VTQPCLEYFAAYLKQSSQLLRVENIRAKAGERLIVVSGAFPIEGSG